MPESTDPPPYRRATSMLIICVVCACLGSCGGCTLQFSHDLNGGHGPPTYIMVGAGLGLLIGIGIAFSVRRDDPGDENRD